MQYARFSLIVASSLAVIPAQAAPAGGGPKPAAPVAAARPAPALKAIRVAPTAATLVGPRSEQGLVVTGEHADGSLRDLTGAATFVSSNPRAVKVARVGSRILATPVADGAASVTLRVGGAPPVTVRIEAVKTAAPAPVSFRHEVVPALTKAGCSLGTCHGTPTGKGGFRLSLQGYAPELDFHTLTREGGSRRVNAADPQRSMVLLKPMGEMPHGGGKRLSPDMPEFKVLYRWISEGARDDGPDVRELVKVEVLPGPRQLLLPGAAKQQIVAMAHFSDGTARDVTSLAKLDTSNPDAAEVTREGLVTGSQRGGIAVLVRYQERIQSLRLTYVQNIPGFKWDNPEPFNLVDPPVFERLKLLQIPISPLASDREFLRRAYLDTLGLLPTAAEARAFLADKSADKRARLIDQLTQRPEFADFWAIKWADVLRIQDDALGEGPAKAYHQWVRDSLAANKPMDQFARELLTARGSTLSVPPAGFHRTARESDGKVLPDSLSQATTQVFFGVRMLCAKCHNHPFEHWTQDDYYALAAFFAQVKARTGPGKGEETVFLDPNGEVEHLRTGKVMTPKLPGAATPEIPKGQDRRVVLADWLTQKDNPFFSKAVVNRVWANLLGSGMVEPIDDFRESNPSVNDALLEALAKDFAEHRFDLRHLVRTIMKSRTYQLTAQSVPLNKDDATYFSHAQPRRLTAEQLADAIAQVTGVPDKYAGYPAGTRATQLAGTKVRTEFLRTFGRPDRNLNCECEREKEPTLFQALNLLTNREIHAKFAAETGRVAQLAASSMSDADVIDEMYYSALARPPSPREKQGILSHFARTGDRRKALEDLAWVLINSKEFLFRH
jgi:hypothetical protein